MSTMEPVQVNTTAEPGWYPDQAGMIRWWDGAQWTEHVQPAPTQQVIVQSRKPYKTSHAFHLIMTLVTFGLWLPVWVIVGIYNASKA